MDFLLVALIALVGGVIWSEHLIKREEQLKSSGSNKLPPHELPPQLPVRTEYSGGSPYRTPSLVPAEVAEEDKIPKSISFERFVEYWRSVGLPDNLEGSREFRKLAERIDFGSRRRFAAFLNAEISRRYENHECVCRPFRNLALSNILIAAVAVRNREADADLLCAIMQKVTWTEQYYVLIEAIGRIWPVKPEVIRSVVKMTEWRRKSDPDGTGFVNLAARDALAEWRKRDPEGYRRRSQSLLG